MPVALLYLIGVSSLGVYGVVLGGWSSGSKYSLLGALRGGAQVVSYELVLGLALVGVVLVSGTLSIGQIVDRSKRRLGAVRASCSRSASCCTSPRPSRRPIAPRSTCPRPSRSWWRAITPSTAASASRCTTSPSTSTCITVSAIAATLFFGGWTGPFNLLNGPWWLLIKMVVFAFVFVWLRATLPRLRYDQLMRLSWGLLLPLGLLNVLVTAGRWSVAFSGGAHDRWMLDGARALAKGFWTTLRHVGAAAHDAAPTPRSSGELPAAFRGRHRLYRHEDGLERCIGCELCAAPARPARSTSRRPTTIRPHPSRRASATRRRTRST